MSSDDNDDDDDDDDLEEPVAAEPIAVARGRGWQSGARKLWQAWLARGLPKLWQAWLAAAVQGWTSSDDNDDDDDDGDLEEPVAAEPIAVARGRACGGRGRARGRLGRADDPPAAASVARMIHW